MATFRKRNGNWQAQVRCARQSAVSRTFPHKAEAVAWARQIEADSLPVANAAPANATATLADLLVRYRDEVSCAKRGGDIEAVRLNRMLAHPFSQVPLPEISSVILNRYRAERLKQVQPETVRRELTLLHHLFEVARDEWGVAIDGNPMQAVKKPKPATARDRRLEAGEFERLMLACSVSRNAWLEPLVRLAIETGMRRGEILNMKWQDIDLDRKVLHIPITKTGHTRRIPLSTAAMVILMQLPIPHTGQVFDLTPNAVKLAWRRLVLRAGLEDLHLHDLRHEAISRFFEKGLGIAEVALISGHRDFRQLFRYTHLRAEDVAGKLG